MSHPRTQIRAAVVALLTGLPITGSNVFASRVRPFHDSELPALNVLTAFAISDLVVLAIGESPIGALRSLVVGSLGSAEGLGFTLYYATNFIFTGLAVALDDREEASRRAGNLLQRVQDTFSVEATAARFLDAFLAR